MSLRWGILSAGRISNDFVCAVQTLPSTDHEIVAVAARSQEDASAFAASHNIPKAYGTYEALAQDKTINIVYVGTINTKHLESAKAMLDAGKHVLCEKPLVMNTRQCRELLEYARQKGLFLMEAVWSRCFPVYRRLGELLRPQDGSDSLIGDVMHVSVQFGFPLTHVDRVNVKELGGGTILDLGIYTLQLLQFVYRGMPAPKIVAAGHLNSLGTDESANAILTYVDPLGRKATGVMSTSARVQLPNEAVIVGTKGTIRIPDFWSPCKLITPTETIEFALPLSAAKFNFNNSQGLAYEAEEARRCINLGLLESPAVTHSESLELCQQMDDLRAQIGVVYAEDK